MPSMRGKAPKKESLNGSKPVLTFVGTGFLLRIIPEFIWNPMRREDRINKGKSNNLLGVKDENLADSGSFFRLCLTLVLLHYRAY
jgi:hypothetical protein